MDIFKKIHKFKNDITLGQANSTGISQDQTVYQAGERAFLYIHIDLIEF